MDASLPPLLAWARSSWGLASYGGDTVPSPACLHPVRGSPNPFTSRKSTSKSVSQTSQISLWFEGLLFPFKVRKEFTLRGSVARPAGGRFAHCPRSLDFHKHLLSIAESLDPAAPMGTVWASCGFPSRSLSALPALRRPTGWAPTHLHRELPNPGHTPPLLCFPNLPFSLSMTLQPRPPLPGDPPPSDKLNMALFGGCLWRHDRLS